MKSDTDQIYAVELLFETAPKIQSDVLLSALQQACPGIEPMGDLGKAGTFHFAHSSHRAQYQEGSIPAQLVLYPGERKDDSTKISEAVQQSWNLPDAEKVVASLPHKILVHDMMARGLPYKERLSIFLDALEAIISTLGCRAIHWRASQQMISAAYFLEERGMKDRHILFSGPLNVRFFNIADGKFAGEAIADTMGLAVFRLPDIQCHFHGLDINDVVRLLYNPGVYVFDHGDVIKPGQTISGVGGEKWVCLHEDAQLRPQRVVLDINPGFKYAAGERG